MLSFALKQSYTSLEDTTTLVLIKLYLFLPIFLKIKHGAMLCKQNKLGHFAMHAAAFAGAKKAMEVILKAGMRKKTGSVNKKIPNC